MTGCNEIILFIRVINILELFVALKQILSNDARFGILRSLLSHADFFWYFELERMSTFNRTVSFDDVITNTSQASTLWPHGERFLARWLDSIEAIGFIWCFIIFIVIIYVSDNVNTNVKITSILSIFLYSISCIAYTFARHSDNDFANYFVLVQFCWASATILSYILFVHQLYVIYNKHSSVYQISKLSYFSLFILLTIFACSQFIKAPLILFLKNGILSSDIYGKMSLIAISSSSIADLVITICLLYMFNSRLSKSIKHLDLYSTQNATQQNVLNTRIKQSLLTTFALLATQMYLILWAFGAFIIYIYNGENKNEYVYNITISACTFRVISCITNSMVRLFNFKFASKYYKKCCYLCLCCYVRHYSLSCVIINESQFASNETDSFNFEQGENNFEELIKKHIDLTDEIELQQLQTNEKCNIVGQTPKQAMSLMSQKQLQINEFQERYKLTKSVMDEWLIQLHKMQHVEQQENRILHDYSTRLNNHTSVVNKLLSDSRYQRLDVSKHNADITSTEKTYTEYNFEHIDESDKIIPELGNVSIKEL
eukprot:40387_1